ncbi:hypothetical protein EDB85DRAFT_1888778 [Lactarius pseudohatsudake]|nr:hypothetical protein EDB85DRAFT_1888778 [Lactarius pseudohatsudake]
MVTVLMKLRHNSGCAVTALPPELLSHVFSVNLLSDRPGLVNGNYSLGWISVTQVCHRWREIALTTPTLWRYLDFTCMSRRWCLEMLRRSGNCSLDVALRIAGSSGLCPAPTSLDVARELMRPEYSARLAGLRLDITSRTKFSPTIRISGTTAHVMGAHDNQLFTSRLPSLRRLRLSNVLLSPWISPIFTSLQELDIRLSPHRQPHSNDALLTYGEMSTILSRMPELQRLALRNVFLVGTRADEMPNGRISLPNLRQLSLIDQQGSDLSSFAASLCLPPETCAEIKTNGRVWLDTLLPQYELTFGPVRRLKLLVNGYPQVSLEFRAADALTVERSSPAQLRLAYSLLPSPAPAPPHAAESPLFPPNQIAHHFGAAQLRLEGLLCLDIASYVPWPADSWHTLFAHATRLRQVRATYRGAVDGLILQVLLGADNHDEGSRMLPSLRSVKLSLVDLDEAVDAVDPPRARGDLLVDGLARRRGLPGSEICELEVPDNDGCWIAKLRPIVPSVLHACGECLGGICTAASKKWTKPKGDECTVQLTLLDTFRRGCRNQIRLLGYGAIVAVLRLLFEPKKQARAPIDLANSGVYDNDDDLLGSRGEISAVDVSDTITLMVYAYRASELRMKSRLHCICLMVEMDGEQTQTRVSNWNHYYGNQSAHYNNTRCIGDPSHGVHGHQEKMPIRNTMHAYHVAPRGSYYHRASSSSPRTSGQSQAAKLIKRKRRSVPTRKGSASSRLVLDSPMSGHNCQMTSARETKNRQTAPAGQGVRSSSDKYRKDLTPFDEQRLIQIGGDHTPAPMGNLSPVWLEKP